MNEMLRNNFGLDWLQNLLFVDSSELFKALDGSLTNGCVKLQCLFSHMKPLGEQLAAHRALERTPSIQQTTPNSKH